MSEGVSAVYIISFFSFVLIIGFSTSAHYFLTRKRVLILERLQNLKLGPSYQDEDDVLGRPFLERTLGALSNWLVKVIGQATPRKVKEEIDLKLEKAGNPKNLKAGDFLAIQGILGVTVLVSSFFAFTSLDFPFINLILLFLTLTALAVYLPWFTLAKMATKRERDIKRNLPDIMDLLVISVEAGLGFDMALQKVVERFRGTVAIEFQKVLREMQLGKPRKDALKSMANRVSLPELSSLINAIIQSEQLGVGLGSILRMQADLIREKRQQFIEEQAMKAPIKMLFPLVFFIFPSIFIVILGPAMLNIMKVLGGD